MAKHAPSAALATSSGAAPPAGVPLASSASCATCTGIVQLKSKYGADGRVRGITIQGLDYIGALTANSESAGTVLSTVSLNPYDPAWNGTALQRFATLFERYRPRRIAALVEPSCAATTNGQIISFIDPDPDDTFDYTGRQAIQVAASHEGADISQVWGMNVSAYAFDKRTQDFYADADGSDERLISPGNWRVLANSDLPATTPIGTLYVAWDYEFLIPQIEQHSQGGSWARLETSVTNPIYPLGPDPWSVVREAGDISASLGNASATASQVWGLPAGEYFIALIMNDIVFASGDPIGMAGVTVSGSYTNLTPIEELIVPVALPTPHVDVLLLFSLTVPEKTASFADGGLQVTQVGPGDTGTSVGETIAIFTTLATSYTALSKRHRTLQELEAEFEEMLRTQRTAHSPAAAAAAGASPHQPRHRFLKSAAIPSALRPSSSAPSGRRAGVP
jgi:hypothetical protein